MVVRNPKVAVPEYPGPGRPGQPGVRRAPQNPHKSATRRPVPWASATGRDAGYIDELHPRHGADAAAIKFTGDAYLGYAAIAAILAETGNWIKDYPAAIRDFHLYAAHRMHPEQRQSLPKLPVPDKFKQMFLDWAEGKVNFTGPAPE